MLHKAWNSKGEMPYCFPRSSIKFQGHTVQNITDFDPNWAFPDCRPVAAFKSLRFALLMVCRTIIDVILHLFIICNDLWCQLPFLSQTFRHNGIAVFGTMPPMCRSCPDVNKLWGMDTTILGQHRPFMSIKSFVQHSGWQKMVSLCSLIRLIGVCADRDQPEFLCSRSDSRNL